MRILHALAAESTGRGVPRPEFLERWAFKDAKLIYLADWPPKEIAGSAAATGGEPGRYFVAGNLNLELPPDACTEIENHLAGCPPCIEFAESLRKTVDLCRHYRSTELPEPMGNQARKELLDAYQKMLAARKINVSMDHRY